jgi:crossover junction endodeoxyribonuclease RuvC
MTVLALDTATQCGFALLRADARIESGSRRFDVKSKERPGARWVKFKGFLLEMKACHPDLRLIAYEDVKAHGPGVLVAHIYGGFVATLQAFCEHHQIEYVGYGVGTVKKAWTGNGAARKEQMVARCRELGFEPEDDNEADAIALLHLATGRVPKLPIDRLGEQRPLRPNADTRSREISFPSSLPEKPF